PGGLGGLARGLSPNAAVQVVELARQLCRRSRTQSEMGRSFGRGRGCIPQQGRRREALTWIEIRAVNAPLGALTGKLARYENKRSISTPIATPAIAAPMPIETVSATVRMAVRLPNCARPRPSPMSRVTVTIPETIRA